MAFILSQQRGFSQHGLLCAGSASAQSQAKAVEAPVIPQEKAQPSSLAVRQQQLCRACTRQALPKQTGVIARAIFS